MRSAITIPSKQNVKHQFGSQPPHLHSMQIRSETVMQTSNTRMRPWRSSTWPDPSHLLTVLSLPGHQS